MKAMKRTSFVKDLKNPKFTYELEKTNETVIKIFQFTHYITRVLLWTSLMSKALQFSLSVKSYLLHSCTYDRFLLFKSSFCL